MEKRPGAGLRIATKQLDKSRKLVKPEDMSKHQTAGMDKVAQCAQKMGSSDFIADAISSEMSTKREFAFVEPY